MKTFTCPCGNTVFFENSQCVACHREVGWCPACRTMTALTPSADGGLRCGHSACGRPLVKCFNYAVEQVCNRCVIAPNPVPATPPFCDYCRFNQTIPDLSVPGNRERWQRLEIGKRRLLYTLDLLGLRYGTAADGVEPSLAFDFKEDVEHPHHWWRAMGGDEQVFTGHAHGKITINVREADSVEREKARVYFQEARRTVIGHFRHEIGHYFWQLLVEGRCEPECSAVFGDHLWRSYDAARQDYYQAGPPPDWATRFVSGYATMHPWEDFAETFSTYLDMTSVLDTARHMGLGDGTDPLTADFEIMVRAFVKLSIALNEMNRAMGLPDLAPELFVAPVVEKLRFIHALVRRSIGRGDASAAPAGFSAGG